MCALGDSGSQGRPLRRPPAAQSSLQGPRRVSSPRSNYRLRPPPAEPVNASHRPCGSQSPRGGPYLRPFRPVSSGRKRCGRCLTRGPRRPRLFCGTRQSYDNSDRRRGSEPRRSRDRDGRSERGGRGDDIPPSSTLVLRSLSLSTTEEGALTQGHMTCVPQPASSTDA